MTTLNTRSRLAFAAAALAAFSTAASAGEASFRFHAEFDVGVALMRAGLIDVKPLITHTVPLDRAEEAFRVASDRAHAMKAQISFAG